MTANEQVVRELHESSLALLTALRERSPQFLEHLERRDRALLALKSSAPEFRDLALLQAAMVAGDAAALEAHQMRQTAVNSLNSLQSQHSFSRGLSASSTRPCAALDVNG